MNKLFDVLMEAMFSGLRVDFIPLDGLQDGLTRVSISSRYKEYVGEDEIGGSILTEFFDIPKQKNEEMLADIIESSIISLRNREKEERPLLKSVLRSIPPKGGQDDGKPPIHWHTD